MHPKIHVTGFPLCQGIALFRVGGYFYASIHVKAARSALLLLYVVVAELVWLLL